MALKTANGFSLALLFNQRHRHVIFLYYCPRRDFAQKTKSRGGTLVTRAYIKESTYS